MSVLADWQIAELCLAGMVIPYDPEMLNPASIDVRLGDTLLIESAERPEMVRYPLSQHTMENPYLLVPSQFVLGQTLESFNVPDNLNGQFILKSSRAREGLEHLLAGYIDPGFHGSVLTLELKNARQLHAIPLWPGMRIGQIVFTQMSEVPSLSYRQTGRYNNDPTVMESKG